MRPNFAVQYQIKPNRLIPNHAESLEHFYGSFHRPLALFIHHYTQLLSAVQVRSL